MKRLNKIGIVIVVICIIVLTFTNQYLIALDDFQKESATKDSAIVRDVDLSSGFMELVKIYGNNYISSYQGKSEYYYYLEYDSEKGGYHLDSIEGTPLQTMLGNLTGSGRIPTSGIKLREINLAFNLNTYFRKVYEMIPDVTWIYYTSNNDFVSMYPWVSSEDFFYEEGLKEANFFTYVKPENNPERKSVWTPVYDDYAGQSHMVTYSCPLYYGQDFMGAISLDFTCVYLSKLMSTDYEGYLEDQNGSVIAVSKAELPTQISSVREVMKYSEPEWRALKKLSKNKVNLFRGNYIYIAEYENAPWILYYRVPLWRLVLKALFLTLPALLITVLFLFIVKENEKHKQTQTLLSATVEELKIYQGRLEYAAKYDFLTNTFNRRGMEEYFHGIIRNTIPKPGFIIMGDLDYFKKLNDTHGHDAGDMVLVNVAGILQNNIEKEDHVCRWGGEEFLVILKRKDKESAMAVAEKIRSDVENLRIPYMKTELLSITITLGITEYNEKLALDRNITNADNALYYGKKNGRNRVVLYHENLFDESNPNIPS